MSKIVKLSLVILLVFVTSNVYADDKFIIDGTNLYYNPAKADNDAQKEITFEDIDIFKKILSENKIELLILNSDGGFVEAAFDISDILIDFGINTHISGECFSACYWLFLTGTKRTMERGSRLGFHQSYMTADGIEEFYLDNKDDEGWDNMYEYAVHQFEYTQQDIFRDFEYQLERGVSPSFIMETIKVESDDEFYPRRKTLLDAGVLTE